MRSDLIGLCGYQFTEENLLVLPDRCIVSGPLFIIRVNVINWYFKPTIEWKLNYFKKR